jgi:hypothetical protein
MAVVPTLCSNVTFRVLIRSFALENIVKLIQEFRFKGIIFHYSLKLLIG